MIAGYRAKTALLGASMLAGSIAAAPAMAQVQLAAAEADATSEGSETIIVTATRRSLSLQDVPINISAIGSDQLKSQGIDDIRDIASFSPGLTVIDTGPRSSGAIVMRGLSASDTSTFGANGDDALATYLGEVPLYLDFKLLDIDRVEVLLGPQGTLYGRGTLAGAIRYIPKRPTATELSGEVHARGYLKSQSSDVGYNGDLAVNIPVLKDHIAFRSVIGYFSDPGFIDYPLLLQTPGISLPQPGSTTGQTDSEYSANLRRAKDVNFEKTFSTRNQLLLQASDDFKAYVTYVYQLTKTDGRQINSNGVLGTGRYEGAARYLEPSRRESHLVSLELNANLFGIADLVTSTAYTEQKITGSSDVTDLLLDLDYDYESFPAFSGFTQTRNRTKQFNQEIRLVSRHGGPFSWVIGGFYNEEKLRANYQEVVPGLPAFFGIDQPDEIEYISFTNINSSEKALFGEGTFNVTDSFQLTGGVRYFKYDSAIDAGISLPLLDTDPAIIFDPGGGTAGDDGFVWKFNTSYKFSSDLLVYATYSKGYRIGGANRVGPCPVPLGNFQNACAAPDELFFGPDKTKNLEIGVRTTLFDGRLTGSLAAYTIDWEGIQLAGITAVGATGITVNGGKARSRGIELSFLARPTDEISIQGTYSFNDAKLTQDVPALLQIRNSSDYNFRPKFSDVDVFAGDRLPGSTRNSGSLGVTYSKSLKNDANFILNWTATYQGDVVSRVGARAGGEKVPSYITNRASLTYSTPRYEVGFFANNIFNKYAITAIDNDRTRIGINDSVVVRYYNRSVLTPRTVGVEARYKF